MCCVLFSSSGYYYVYLHFTIFASSVCLMIYESMMGGALIVFLLSSYMLPWVKQYGTRGFKENTLKKLS